MLLLKEGNGSTKPMAKRRVEDILYNESFKNKKCDKIKIK